MLNEESPKFPNSLIPPHPTPQIQHPHRQVLFKKYFVTSSLSFSKRAQVVSYDLANFGNLFSLRPSRSQSLLA